MTRFQVRIRCNVCQHKYRRTLEADNPEALDDIADPPCPNCAAVERRIGMDVGGGKAPVVGGSMTVKAVDETARIVMEDHGMSDLRSDVREGETMAPKLPPHMQAKADAMFSRPKGGLLGLPTGAIVKAAVNGRFSTPDTFNPVAAQHAARDRPPVNIINQERRQS